MLWKSLVPTAGEVMTCQVLFVNSVPVRNESLLVPAKETLLRTTCGLEFVPFLTAHHSLITTIEVPIQKSQPSSEFHHARQPAKIFPGPRFHFALKPSALPPMGGS